MTPWDPWEALRARPHILFRFDPIAGLAGGAVYARRGARAAIVLDPRLNSADRRASLAHELVHDERGGGCDWPDMPQQWSAVISGEEARVDRIVAHRLVPSTQLRAYIAARLDVDDAVTTSDVALAFDVPYELAERALSDASANPRGLVEPADLSGEGEGF